MANIIQIKNSGTSNSEPTANSLSYGELAINYRDGKIFFKDHLGGVGYFTGVTSDTGGIGTSGGGTAASDSEIIAWMNI